MRTTVNIDEHLLDAAKDLAQNKGGTVSSVLEDALRNYLAAALSPPPPLKVLTVGGSGPRPGVDLIRTSQLLEDLDEEVPLAQRR